MMPLLEESQEEIKSFDFKNKPKISLCIVSYNRYDNLERVLPSILGQSIPPDMYEIIVVEDGGTDNSILLINHLRKKYPKHNIRCLYIRQALKEPRCPGFALNVGLRQSKNEIFMMQPADMLHVGESMWILYKELLAQDKIYVYPGRWSMDESEYWDLDISRCNDPEYTYGLWEKAVKKDADPEYTGIIYNGVTGDLSGLHAFRRSHLMQIHGLVNEKHYMMGGEECWWGNVQRIGVNYIVDKDGGICKGGFRRHPYPGLKGRFVTIQLFNIKYGLTPNGFHNFAEKPIQHPDIIEVNPDDNWGYGGTYPPPLDKLNLPPIEVVPK